MKCHDVIVIEFFLRYEAGDHLAIYPTNDTEAVNSLGKILNVDLDEIFSLQNIDGKVLQSDRKFCSDDWSLKIIGENFDTFDT